MRSFKKDLRYIMHLIFFLLCNAAIFGTSEQLMLPDTGEVPQKLVKYYEEKWKQKYRLQETSPFNRGFLRFVSSSDQLSVGYGVLPDSGIEIPNLDLPDSCYKDLRKIGMFVKVFLGYLKGSDSDGSFTPEGINLLVPYVSSVIQWKSGATPKLVPTGFLRREKNGPIVVLLSGAQGKEYQERISKFYNYIYKETEDTAIEVLSADDVADIYIPYLLKEMVEAKRVELFTMKYLGDEVIEKKFRKTFCYVQEAKTDHQQTQNAISLTLEFLKLLIQDQDCISRHDTVSRLRDTYLEGVDTLPSKDKEADFKKFIQKYKQELTKAALDRMDDKIKKIEEMCGDALEATSTFSQGSQELQILNEQLEEYNKWRRYLEYCLYPLSSLSTLEKAQSLWGLIRKLKDELQCPNPNGGRAIDAVKRLYKACYPSNDNLNHTERLLIGFFKAKPQSLLGDLKEQFEKKKSSNTPLVIEAGFPKYLGIITDSFSWLDVCKSCADFLHTNPIWESAVQDVRPLIEAEGFTVPFPKINGMFRFVSQDHYPVTYNNYNGSVPPIDLADAGGGKNYRNSGWDFRVLSEERISLATRYSPRETLIRDRVIEGIQNRLIDAVSTHTSLEFFTAPWLWAILDMHRPFCINALRLFQAYHPENAPLKLKLAQKMEYNNPHCYHLLRSIITIPNETMKQQPYADVFLGEKIKENPQEYTRVFFGEGCIAKINVALESQPIQDISSFVIDFAKYSCVFDSKNQVQPITEEITTFGEATVSIVSYWKNKWKKGARVYNTSNYESDAKIITEFMIEKLQRLSTLEQEEDLPFEKTALCEALGQLTIK